MNYKRIFIKLFLSALFFPLFSFAQDFDVLIINGKIIDGTGNSWYIGNVGIKNGVIQKIGKTVIGTASKTIDAKGLVIAPGFIDVHTHLEGDEAAEPEAKSFVHDGVTTCVTGNCGSSNTNIKQYFNWLDSLRPAINIATLIGHNDVRREVMGRANRDATPQELKAMENLVEQAMKDGAVGLSTGLIYIPGTYTKTPEIISLAKVAAKYNGVYASHMRNEGDKIVEAINEALAIGREAGLPVQISHFKLSGQQNWGRSKETIEMVKQARISGLDVTIDQYPYTASSTSINTLVPDEILADNLDSIRARLQRPEVRKYVSNYIQERLKKRGLKHLSYAVVANYRKDSTYNGKSIEEINRMIGRKHKIKYEAETVMDIVANGGASAVFHGMGEEDVRRIMQYPYNMFASDASIRVYGKGVPHPRGYGTNARVLGKYVREEKVITLEEAIRRMTSLPAQKFQLKNRGLLLPGYAADVLVFDSEKVTDNATFERPHAYSTGFVHVLVNGILVVENSANTHQRPGMVLFGPGKTIN